MNSDVDKAKADFARRLNKAMDIAGYPVRGRARILSKKFDVSDKGAGKWVKGDAMPETAKIPLIAAFLSVNSEWLLSGKGEMCASLDIYNGIVETQSQTYVVQSKQYVSGTAAVNLRLSKMGGLNELIDKFIKMEKEGRLTEDFIKSIDGLINVVEKAQDTKDQVANGTAPDTKTA